MWNMKKWLLGNKYIIIGTIVGGIAGYIYYKQIGCSNGSCAITSDPYNSIIYFAFMGGLLTSIIKPSPKNEKKSKSL